MRFYKYIISTIICTALLFAIIFWSIVCCTKNVFDTNYCSVIQNKYDYLINSNEPKIIILSGSSSAFGLNQKMLEDATGYKVANMGLHAGFGYLFPTELAKANINEGDIVLLGYEIGWNEENGFEDFGTDLIMAGIDDNVTMYKHMPIYTWKNIIGYLLTYASKKNSNISAGGVYSSSAFDLSTGQMIYDRPDSIVYDPQKHGNCTINGSSISEPSIKYLKELKKYIESRNANVYFIAYPILEDSISNEDRDALVSLKLLEEKEIGIKYISNPTEYLMPANYMYDTIYHCNTEGETYRTKLLIEDLKRSNIA